MDNKNLVKEISSFVFGDGALSSIIKKYNQKNSLYYIKQLSVHKDYIDYQADVISNITRTRIETVPEHIDNRGYKNQEMYNLYSMKHSFFTTIRERFYSNSGKQIDPHYLKLWDLKTLCYFYMDNGNIDKKQTVSNGVYVRTSLYTHAYSYGDVFLLKKWLKEKFDFNFDIQRHKMKSGNYKWYLRNTKDNSKRFLDKIYKYSFSSFEYKFIQTIDSHE